jgi:hypothetical protein
MQWCCLLIPSHFIFPQSAVTSRLEDVATATTGTPLISQTSTSAIHEGMAAHAPVIVAAGTASIATGSNKSDLPASPGVQAYQNDIIGAPLKDYVGKSEECGGLIAEHVGAILEYVMPAQ